MTWLLVLNARLASTGPVRKEKNLTLQKTDEQPLKWKETKIGTLRKAFGKILPFEPEK
ncbi:predicted protein [Histoplasma capsulatum G186AR]|uniref:Uncharacterized protein n=2 Tax=Ajellomyces capsulatus TaxID=5037 RepID=C0NYC8_AJECG|nr:uncharacterized protein HCBG_07922 [Histoplasma capsulatum G186AR]EEH03796.1 predicted protein [Histoplasma capsulatum G186AR]